MIVTHDRAEAAELGDSIALMLEGRIVQHDEPRALFERPVSAAVARFFGMVNLLRGTVEDGRLAVGPTTIAAPGPDGAATLAIRPEHVELDHDSTLRATVTESIYAGTHVRLTLQCGAQHLETVVAVPDAPAAGQDVGIVLPIDRLWRLPDQDASAVGDRGST